LIDDDTYHTAAVLAGLSWHAAGDGIAGYVLLREADGGSCGIVRARKNGLWECVQSNRRVGKLYVDPNAAKRLIERLYLTREKK
jgi:hypothetical protein